MAYELKDLQGSLFQDTSERQKDYDGKAMIDGQMYWISGWKKPGKDGKPPWLSLAFKPAGQQSEPEPSGGDFNDEIIFSKCIH